MEELPPRADLRRAATGGLLSGACAGTAAFLWVSLVEPSATFEALAEWLPFTLALVVLPSIGGTAAMIWALGVSPLRHRVTWPVSAGLQTILLGLGPWYWVLIPMWWSTCCFLVAVRKLRFLEGWLGFLGAVLFLPVGVLATAGALGLASLVPAWQGIPRAVVGFVGPATMLVLMWAEWMNLMIYRRDQRSSAI